MLTREENKSVIVVSNTKTNNINAYHINDYSTGDDDKNNDDNDNKKNNNNNIDSCKSSIFCEEPTIPNAGLGLGLAGLAAIFKASQYSILKEFAEDSQTLVDALDVIHKVLLTTSSIVLCVAFISFILLGTGGHGHIKDYFLRPGGGGSFAATMAVMVIASGGLSSWPGSDELASIVWCVAVISHLLFGSIWVIYSIRFVFKRRLAMKHLWTSRLSPAIFPLVVGIGQAGATATSFHSDWMNELAAFCFYLGFVMTLSVTPIVLYRLYHYDTMKVPVNKKNGMTVSVQATKFLNYIHLYPSSWKSCCDNRNRNTNDYHHHHNHDCNDSNNSIDSNINDHHATYSPNVTCTINHSDNKKDDNTMMMINNDNKDGASQNVLNTIVKPKLKLLAAQKAHGSSSSSSSSTSSSSPTSSPVTAPDCRRQHASGAILMAPCCLSLSSWMGLGDVYGYDSYPYDSPVVIILAAFGLVLCILTYANYPRFLRFPFHPSWSATTFPSVIVPLSLLRILIQMDDGRPSVGQGAGRSISPILWALAWICTTIAVIVVSSVTFLTFCDGCRWIKKKLSSSSSSSS